MTTRSRPSRTSSRLAAVAQQQTAIQTFGRVTKPVSPSAPSKKRNLSDSSVKERCQATGSAPTAELNQQQEQEQTREEAQEQEPELVRKRHKRDASVSNSLSLESTPANGFFDNDRCSADSEDDRPPCYYEFIALHSSFVTALSIHYAHNNLSAPADLKQLLPSIEKIWKKRKVTREDIQRILHLHKNSSDGKDDGSCAQFRLANYGNGKFCLELVRMSKNKVAFGPPFNEAELGQRFSVGLERIWQMRFETLEDKSPDFDFLLSIPLDPIHNSVSSTTLPRTGRQRLLDLTGGTLRLQTITSDSGIAGNAAKARGSKGSRDRKSGLLQRIQEKQRAQSKLPPPPSKEQILHDSAACHIPEVTAILGLLRPTQAGKDLTEFVPQKRPYKLETLVESIRNSMKTPVPKEEIVKCLDILAQPSVAGHWVSIITINHLTSVVLKSGTTASTAT